MRKLFLCLITSILFLNNYVSAQITSSDSLIALRKLEKMKKELNLSPEQTELLKPKLLDFYEKNSLFEKNIKMVGSVKSQNNQSLEFELSKILTPEQQKIYTQNIAIKKAKKRDLKIRERMAFYRQELKLTEQQYTDLKLLLEKISNQKLELKDKYQNNDEMFQQEMKKLRGGFDLELKKILNKEQLQKFKQIQEIRKG